MIPTEIEPLTAEEQELLDFLERTRGRKLSEQEAFLALEQAKAIGELAIGYS